LPYLISFSLFFFQIFYPFLSLLSLSLFGFVNP
jgi:hypothetical protein